MDRKDLNNQIENKQNFNIVKRIKLKRLTKLICTLDEKWNNREKLTGLFNIGVDGIEIYSEIDSEIQKQLIYKIREFEKENLQFVTILYNLSYFHIYVLQINDNDKELNINQNDIIYIKNSNNDEKSLESGESLLFPYIITEPKLLFDNFSNDIIHINYGEISLKVEKVNKLFLKCVALNSGTIHKQNLLSVYIIL